MLIVGAFILVFVGLGTFYIGKSEALIGHDCMARTYSYAPYNYYWCVAQLQTALQIEHSHHGSAVPSPGTADGRFGGNTLTSLKYFESNVVHEYPDGTVTAWGAVWRRLCSDTNAWNSDVWYSIGCYNF